MENTTSVVRDWADVLSSTLGLSPTAFAALLSTFASLGLLSCLAVLPYCFRLCRGHDVVTECRIGRSIVTLSIDATGNGLHAAQKLVVDVAGRRARMEPTGGQDSPEQGAHPTPSLPGHEPTRSTPPVPRDRQKSRRAVSSATDVRVQTITADS